VSVVTGIDVSTRMRWNVSWRADPVTRDLADRHYNRQNVGAAQFVPPGSCLVFRTEAGDAAWVTSWPIAEYVQHAWAGAWVNSLFRNENRANLSSELIREAVSATLAHWPQPPPLGIVSFVDATKTRRKRDPGRCYRRAGFRHVGFTQGGLWVFQMLPAEMPEPREAIGTQMELVA
jgi:hypothetical protein